MSLDEGFVPKLTTIVGLLDEIANAVGPPDVDGSEWERGLMLEVRAGKRPI